MKRTLVVEVEMAEWDDPENYQPISNVMYAIADAMQKSHYDCVIWEQGHKRDEIMLGVSEIAIYQM